MFIYWICFAATLFYRFYIHWNCIYYSRCIQYHSSICESFDVLCQYVCVYMLYVSYLFVCLYCLKHAIFTITKSVCLWFIFRNRRLFFHSAFCLFHFTTSKEKKICHTLKKSNHKHFHWKCFRQLPFFSRSSQHIRKKRDNIIVPVHSTQIFMEILKLLQIDKRSTRNDPNHSFRFIRLLRHTQHTYAYYLDINRFYF